MTLIDLVFSKLRPPITWSDKSLKSIVSEDPSTSNIVNVPKHWRNVNHRTFNIFIDYHQVNWVSKWVSYWHTKSWDCFFTHWLPKKSIFFLIKTIQPYQFRCNYLRNKKLFMNFLLHFLNLEEILNNLKKKMTLAYFASSKLRTPKT